MDLLIDVQNYMSRLVAEGATPEDLVSCTLRNLYSLEQSAFLERKTASINCIRACIAYVKILYDHSQQMDLSRKYLLHKMKLLEVREKDRSMEISVVRGGSPPNNGSPLSCNGSMDNGNATETLPQGCGSHNDPEIDIALDARMIREIDYSKGKLNSIISRIEDKKNALNEIEHQIEDASSVFFSSMDCSMSSFDKEHIQADSSCRVERTQVFEATNRSRVDGARISPSKMDTKMEKSQDNEKSLPSQGALGTPRDRHSGAPDAAGSTVAGRESREGTTEAVSVSASADQVATAEQELEGSQDTQRVQEEEMEDMSTQAPAEKRKATSSPDIDSDNLEGVGCRRPTKARIVDSEETESCNEDASIIISSGAEEEGETRGSPSPSSSPCRRITRGLKKRGETTADFSVLAEGGHKKGNRDKNSEDRLYHSSPDSVDKIIDPIVARVRQEEEELRNVASSDDEEYNEIQDSSINKKNKNPKTKQGKKQGDVTVKNPSQNTKRKAIPKIVEKEEAAREVNFTRQDWLDMNPAALGARCLDHLQELDRQRSLSSNISGMVAGRMIQSSKIAMEITKALVEKLTITGDVYSLRTENVALRDDLGVIKRQNEAQSQEIDALRRTIVGLEREVRSLKEGFGPFPAANSSGLGIKPDRTFKSTGESKDSRKKKTDMYNRQYARQQELQRQEQTWQQKDRQNSQEMEIEFPSNEDLSSADKELNRQQADDWPTDEDRTAWSTEVQVTAAEEESGVEAKEKDKISDYNSTKTKLGSLQYNANTNTKINKVKSVPKIRIIEDRQIVPPSRPLNALKNEWQKVGKRGRIVSGSSQNSNAQQSIPPSLSGNSNFKSAVRSGANLRKKLVKPAVVTITSKPGGSSYADILAKAREKVSLSEIGIQETVIRRALNGAIVIEVTGPRSKQLAGVLGSRLSEALGEEAKVRNPVATGELRLRGIDPSTTSEEIKDDLEALSGCVRSELKVSPINTMRDGMGIAWVVCPIDTALKIAEYRQIRIGWTRVKVELLRKRPVQCYRCWHFGHVRPSCRSGVDRSGACFRCGSVGHSASGCSAGAPKCVVCEEIGKDSRHRLGSPRCLENQGFPSGVQQISRPLANRRRQVDRDIINDRTN